MCSPATSSEAADAPLVLSAGAGGLFPGMVDSPEAEGMPVEGAVGCAKCPWPNSSFGGPLRG